MKHHYTALFLLVSLFTFSGCEDIVDCIINVRPELGNDDLDRAYLDEYYFDAVTAEIKNEPNDNDYDYYFSVSGRIPRGIDVIYERRRVVFEGVPLEKGSYTIKVSLEVEALNGYYYDDFGNERYDDPLCSDNTSKTYTLVVR